MPGSEVDRVAGLSSADFSSQYLSRSPVIITDAISSWAAMDWTVEELRDRFINAKLPLRMDDEEFDAFCAATGDLCLRAAKEESALRHRRENFWIVRLSAYFDAVLQMGAGAGKLPYIMDIPMSRRVLNPYLHILQIEHTENWDILISALEQLISEVAFPDYLSGDRDYRFWFAPGRRRWGTIHADGYDNLNAQIKGRKEWILRPPGGRRLDVPRNNSQQGRVTMEINGAEPQSGLAGVRPRCAAVWRASLGRMGVVCARLVTRGRSDADMVVLYRFAPHEALLAGIVNHTDRWRRHPLPRRLVVGHNRAAGCWRDTNMVARHHFAPDETLLAGVRAGGAAIRGAPAGGGGVILCGLRAGARRHTDMVGRRRLTPHEALLADI